MNETHVVCLVEGTWGGAQWATTGSPFRVFLAQRGIRFTDPFLWSHDVGGLPRPFSWWTTGKFSDWRAAGFALKHFLRGLPYESRNVIAHSHGGQCALFAAGEFDCWIRRLVTVATPPRKDMLPVAAAAKRNLGHWLHVAAQEHDLKARLGQVFDGRLRGARAHPLADVNVLIPKIGHSKILTDPAGIEWWEKGNLLTSITAGDEDLGARRLGGSRDDDG